MDEIGSTFRTALDACDVRLLANSRAALVLARYERIVEALRQTGQLPILTEEDLEVVSELRQLEYIALAFDSASTEEQEKFRIALQQDAVSESGNHSPGRDFLMELFVAARLRMAGALVEMVDPPDLIASLNGQRFGIAVKRVKSMDVQLEKRVREGAKQLQKSGLPGFVYVDLSVAFRRRVLGHTTVTKEDRKEKVDLFARALSTRAKDVQRWTKGKKVNTVVFSCSSSHWDVRGFDTIKGHADHYCGGPECDGDLLRHLMQMAKGAFDEVSVHEIYVPRRDGAA